MASKSKNEEYPKFSNFTFQVDVERGSWTKTVKKVINSVQGVTSFRMENGEIKISGYIDPALLLKSLGKAGKKAQIVELQYGDCSSNLLKKTQAPSNNNIFMNPGYYGGYITGYGYYPSYHTNNHAFNHLNCAGDASDCSGYHIKNPPKSSSSSSSSSRFQKLAKSVPTSCCFM